MQRIINSVEKLYNFYFYPIKIIHHRDLNTKSTKQIDCITDKCIFSENQYICSTNDYNLCMNQNNR